MTSNDIIDVVISHIVRAANDKLGPAAGEWLKVFIELLDKNTRRLIVDAINTTKISSVDGEFIDESSNDTEE